MASRFTVRISGEHTQPYIPDGEAVSVSAGEPIRDGDVGLFFAQGKLRCRQYCEDYAGNVYLFTLDRRHPEEDLFLPASANVPLCCFGKVMLEEEIPLP